MIPHCFLFFAIVSSTTKEHEKRRTKHFKCQKMRKNARHLKNFRPQLERAQEWKTSSSLIVMFGCFPPKNWKVYFHADSTASAECCDENSKIKKGAKRKVFFYASLYSKFTFPSFSVFFSLFFFLFRTSLQLVGWWWRWNVETATKLHFSISSSRHCANQLKLLQLILISTAKKQQTQERARKSSWRREKFQSHTNDFLREKLAKV